MKKIVKFTSLLAILLGVVACAGGSSDAAVGNSAIASIPNYPSSSSTSNNNGPIINSTNSTSSSINSPSNSSNSVSSSVSSSNFSSSSSSSSSPVVVEEHMVTFNYDWYIYSNMTLSTENGYIEKPENPTRTNYVFSGWYLGNELFDFNSLVTEDITLVARWSQVHSVVFNYNYDNKQEILTTTDYIEEPETPVREGYLFDGWYNYEGLFDFSQLIIGYMSLHAEWVKIPTEEEFVNDCILSTSTIANGAAITRYNGYSQSLYIPSYVKEIKYDAFKSGTFKYVFFGGTLEDWCSIAFENEYSNPMCTAERFYMLNEDNQWDATLLNDLVIPESITKLNSYSFSGFECIKTVTIPNTVNLISSRTFYKSESIEKMTLPFIGEANVYTNNSEFGYIFDSRLGAPMSLKEVVVTGHSFGNFGGAGYVEKITIEAETTEITSFTGAMRLKEVILPENMDYLPFFTNCYDLVTVNIPSGVTTLHNDHFRDCTSLQSIELPEGLESIGTYAFAGCTSLKSIVIPNSVEYLGQYAFHKCSALEDVVIGDGLYSINDYTFHGCTSIKNLVLGAHLSQIYQYSFYNCNNIENLYYRGSNSIYIFLSYNGQKNALAKAKHFFILNANNEYEEITIQMW